MEEAFNRRVILGTSMQHLGSASWAFADDEILRLRAQNDTFFVSVYSVL
jgi:hypothetical protein